MILRRYGTSFHSVGPNFNSAAMTEVGFQKDREFVVSVEDFEAGYEVAGDVVELVAEADAPVQSDAESRVLEILEEVLNDQVAALKEGQVLVILNDRDDQPKTRERRESIMVDGENKLGFCWWIDPALRVATYRQVG